MPTPIINTYYTLTQKKKKKNLNGPNFWTFVYVNIFTFMHQDKNIDSSHKKYNLTFYNILIKSLNK